MEITEVRIKLMEDSDDRLQAFCSITFDNCFVIRDLKIIEGANGAFVAMPSRKLTAHCRNCGSKNHLRAGYCNACGGKLREDRASRDADGRTKLYADIAHPINSECREMIQDRVIAEFDDELERAKQPDYVSRYDDDYDDLDELPPESGASRPPGARTSIQQAEKPQGPHRASRETEGRETEGREAAAAKTPAKTPPAREQQAPKQDGGDAPQPDKPKDDDFGAGIFD